MPVLTIDILQAGTGCNAARAAAWLPHIAEGCRLFGIDTSAMRLAAYLAQIGHESGRLVYVREIWGPTPAQQRYEGRADLGNTQPGDGRRYLGRGLIQITGRANYAAVRDGLSGMWSDVPDFEGQPALLESPRWAAVSSAWYWYSRGLNTLADAGDFLRITRRINGGTNGLADRQALYARARQALGLAGV